MPQQNNWAGNLTYSGEIKRPGSLAELQQLIANAQKVRPLGTRHSFNTIADTSGTLISAANMPPVLELDSARKVVRVSGHLRYGDIATWLHERGWAVANLASLPHISIAGAIATGTHGSGDRIGTLASAVAKLEIVRADGSVHTVSRGDANFAGLVVGLGAFGMVTAVELDVVPTFDVTQHVYQQLPLAAAIEHYDAITSLGYSVSLFTSWADPDTFDQVWVKRAVGGGDLPLPDQIHEALPATAPSHPLPGMDPVNCTQQLGVSGPWYDRLPHFRLEFTPSNGDELQTEYLVPRENMGAALQVIRSHREAMAPYLFVNEVRSMAADDLWLSPAYERDTVGFHFTWKPAQAKVEALLPELEAELLPLGARPHWGKLFAAQACELALLYRRFDDAVALMQEWDPQGKFVNDFLAQKFSLPA